MKSTIFLTIIIIALSCSKGTTPTVQPKDTVLAAARSTDPLTTRMQQQVSSSISAALSPLKDSIATQRKTIASLKETVSVLTTKLTAAEGKAVAASSSVATMTPQVASINKRLDSLPITLNRNQFIVDTIASLNLPALAKQLKPYLEAKQ